MTAGLDLPAICQSAGLPCDPLWLPQLAKLALLVADAQTRTNLVGDATAAGVQAHVLEAMTVAAVAQQVLGRPVKRAVDLGAGAGLEALTLALIWPDAQVFAVEPRKLRAAFTVEAAAALDLRNLTVVAKSLFSANLRPIFDLATARAVWPFPEWPERGRAVLAPGGCVAVHTHGPAAALTDRLHAPGWRLVASRDVPGPKVYAVAGLVTV